MASCCRCCRPSPSCGSRPLSPGRSWRGPSASATLPGGPSCGPSPGPACCPGSSRRSARWSCSSAAVTIIGPASIPLGRLLAFEVTYGIFLGGVGAIAGAAAAVAQQRPTVRGRGGTGLHTGRVRGGAGRSRAATREHRVGRRHFPICPYSTTGPRRAQPAHRTRGARRRRRTLGMRQVDDHPDPARVRAARAGLGAVRRQGPELPRRRGRAPPDGGRAPRRPTAARDDRRQRPGSPRSRSPSSGSWPTWSPSPPTSGPCPWGSIPRSC